MKKTQRLVKVTGLIKEVEQRILDIYWDTKAAEENKIVFLLNSKMPTDLLKELVDEKWWFKWYDRTFYLVKLRQDHFVDIAALKNTMTEEEQEEYINSFDDVERTIEIRSGDGSFISEIK